MTRLSITELPTGDWLVTSSNAPSAYLAETGAEALSIAAKHMGEPEQAQKKPASGHTVAPGWWIIPGAICGLILLVDIATRALL